MPDRTRDYISLALIAAGIATLVFLSMYQALLMSIEQFA